MLVYIFSTGMNTHITMDTQGHLKFGLNFFIHHMQRFVYDYTILCIHRVIDTQLAEPYFFNEFSH